MGCLLSLEGFGVPPEDKNGFKMSVEAILMHFETFFFLKPTNDKILNLSFLEFGTDIFEDFL